MSAFYFPTPFGTYVEVSVPPVESSNNVICCVDISGSMAGAPLKAVCTVLRDVWARTKTAYSVICYNTGVARTTVEAVAQQDLSASGGTSFQVIFDAMRDTLVAQPVATTFIFMTDGQDSGGDPAAMKRSFDTLRLVACGLKVAVTVHAVGFGGVDADFLERVRKLGSKEGVFRFASAAGELSSSFNDLFEYAAAAREVTLTLCGRVHTAYGNDGSVSFLLEGDAALADPTAASGDGVATVAVTEGEAAVSATVTAAGAAPFEVSLKRLPPTGVTPLQSLKALNLVVPEEEARVREVLRRVHEVPSAGASVLERMELAQLKQDVAGRMMELLGLLTQIKMGQVPAAVKLRLSALRHDATFSDLARKRKLDLRVSKNVEYFKKTDIAGTLAGFKAGITEAGWAAIRAEREQWVCGISGEDIYEVMRRSPDDILCVGVLVERDESAVDAHSGGPGLTLRSVSSTLLSYDAFVRAMDVAKRDVALASGYGAFSGVNDAVCVVGASRDRINAIVPLYINAEHMKRVRILEGPWLGYLFTLDSYGYDKTQEVGLLRLLRDAIAQRTGTAHNARILVELERLCRFIVAESQGFKSAYPDAEYAAYVEGRAGPAAGDADASTTPLMVGLLRGELQRVAPRAYLAHVRRALCASPAPAAAPAAAAAAGASSAVADHMGTVRALLYGLSTTTVATTAPPPDATAAAAAAAGSFVDASFEAFFGPDETAPVRLVPEGSAAAARRAVLDAADVLPTLLPLLPPVPAALQDLCAYAGLGADFVSRTLEAEGARREVLGALLGIPAAGAVSAADARLQGVASAAARFDPTPANVAVVAHAAVAATTLRAFGGILRYYVPLRRGRAFDAIVVALLRACEQSRVIASSNSSNESSPGALAKPSCCPAASKLLALLTNDVGGEPLYVDGIAGVTCWQPPFCQLGPLSDAVGAAEFCAAEAAHVTARHHVLHLYRASGVRNRLGHCNHNPFERNVYIFVGYSDAQ